MWRLLGVDAGLRRARLSFGPPATLIGLLGLLTVSPPCAYAVSPDATKESVGSDPGQSAYAHMAATRLRGRCARRFRARAALRPWGRSWAGRGGGLQLVPSRGRSRICSRRIQYRCAV